MIGIDLGSNYKQAKGEKSSEEINQRQRETSVFQTVYMNPNQIPQNPVREFDELYVKDDKVLQADSDQIANEWFKQRDDEHFRKELELLTVELQQLDEGKSSPPHPILFSHSTPFDPT